MTWSGGVIFVAESSGLSGVARVDPSKANSVGVNSDVKSSASDASKINPADAVVSVIESIAQATSSAAVNRQTVPKQSWATFQKHISLTRVSDSLVAQFLRVIPLGIRS